MRRSFRIYIGPERNAADLSFQTSPLASEILAGLHGEKAQQLLEEEIRKATAQTKDLAEKIRMHTQICSNETLLQQILEKARGNHA